MGGGGGGRTCELLRGHADCGVYENCRPDGSGGGQCVRGTRSGEGLGALCTESNGCESGLCDRGVCTVPCDSVPSGCRAGYACDAALIPGGLCRAEDCEGHGDGFCAESDTCAWSGEQHVCASKDAASCAHTGAGAWTMLALTGALVRRRARHPR